MVKCAPWWLIYAFLFFHPSAPTKVGVNSGNNGGRFQLDRESILNRRPILKAKLPNFKDKSRPIRRKKPVFGPNFEPDLVANNNPDPRFPIRNEIPDSANVQANEGPRADVPPVSAVQNDRESGFQQLNVGKNLYKNLFKVVFFRLT